jgi:hypothetical protein
MVIRVMDILINLSELLILFDLLAVLTSIFFKRLRMRVALLLYLSMCYWMVVSTVWCTTFVYNDYGLFLMIVGLVLGIVGIIPVAAICTLIHRDWVNLGEIVFQVALIIAASLGAGLLQRKAPRLYE